MSRLLKKLTGLAVGLSLVFGFHVVSSTNKNANNAENVEAASNYSTDASTYYNGITATEGKQLAAQLHNLITSTHQTYTSYADNGANGLQKNTDQYYENGSKVNNFIYEFYSGSKWPAAWDPNSGSTSGGYNREHCWCQSNSKNNAGTQMWGTTGGGADMHHIRPVEYRLNSSRGDNVYGEVVDRDSHKVYAKLGTNATYALGGYNSGGVFEPLDSKKGDVARIILYIYIHYNSYTNTDLFGSYGTTNGNGDSGYFTSSLLSLTKTTNQTTEAKAIQMLLEWNAEDQVDEIEQRRNEQVAKYQGNRNPFIDDSTYANKIWGTNTDPVVNSVSVSPSSLSLDLNGTTTSTLTSTVNVSNGAPQTVNWTSSNTNVATVSSSGVVTAKAKGSCTITATSTYNANKSASCSVKVTDSSGGGGGQTETGDFTWDLSLASYNNPTTELVTWSHSYATMESIRTDSNKTAVNNYLGGDSNQRTSSRFYTGNTLKITPASDYTITSVVFTATSNNYATALKNSTWTNASASSSNTTVTVTPTDGTSEFSAIIGGTCGFTSVQVYYETTSSGASALSSITLNTSNVETEFFLNDTFDYSGLEVTAHYEDGTEDIVVPSSVSTPDLSTVGNKTVTVSYTENNVAKTASYTVTVSAAVLEEITLDTSGVKTRFKLNDTFTYAGLVVTATYSNSKTGEVTPTSVSTPDLTSIGTKTVTVSYTLSGVTKTAEYLITVSEAGTFHNYQLYTGELVEGDYLIVYSSKAMKATVSSNRLGYETVSASENIISTNDDSIVWHISKDENYWKIFNADEAKYAVSTGTKNQADLSSTLDDKALWTVSGTSNYEFVNKYNASQSVNSNLRENGEYGYACYSTSTGGALSLYKQSKSLSSISLDTSNVQTVFAVNDTFNYTGLVVTANFSDGSSSTVNPSSVSSPSMSTTGQKNVTVSYSYGDDTKSATYNITVNSNPTLTWTAPNINTYSEKTLTSTQANAWGVTYNNGTGSTTHPTYGQFTVNLGGTGISLPYTWKPGDDGKTLSVSYSSLTTNTTTVSIVQSLQTIQREVSGTYSHTSSSKWTSYDEEQTLTGVTWDPEITWKSSAPDVQNIDGTKGQQIGTGSYPARLVNLSTNELPGTISSIKVHASTASSATATIAIKVGGSSYGGNAQSLTTSNAEYSFTGSASGKVEIIINQPSTSKALYLKSIEIVYAGTVTISNADGHEDAQRAVVKFAKAFNTALGGTSYCTTNLSTAWTTASSAWTTFLSEAAALGSTEEAYAKSLIANATAQWTEGTDGDYSYCLERCLATYEKCVTVHGQTAFMSEVRSVSSSNHISPIVILTSKTNSIAVIVIISMVSMTAIGGYFFIRKRKEN